MTVDVAYGKERGNTLAAGGKRERDTGKVLESQTRQAEAVNRTRANC